MTAAAANLSHIKAFEVARLLAAMTIATLGLGVLPG